MLLGATALDVIPARARGMTSGRGIPQRRCKPVLDSPFKGTETKIPLLNGRVAETVQDNNTEMERAEADRGNGKGVSISLSYYLT